MAQPSRFHVALVVPHIRPGVAQRLDQLVTEGAILIGVADEDLHLRGSVRHGRASWSE
jgi:hypothetical protein